MEADAIRVLVGEANAALTRCPRRRTRSRRRHRYLVCAFAAEMRERFVPERGGRAALLRAARAAGLRWLFGEVLADNARMLAFAHRCGFAETTRGGLEPGVVRVERFVRSVCSEGGRSEV